MTTRTITERHALDAYWRNRVRKWTPLIHDLCPSAPQVKERAPNATKKGPGRVSLDLVRRNRRSDKEPWKPKHALPSRWVTAKDYERHGMPVPDVLPQALDREIRGRRRVRKALLRLEGI